MHTLSVQSHKRQEFIDITDKIKTIVMSQKDVTEGIIVIFTPHTTAGLTINENADPDVLYDLNKTYNYIFPNRDDYRHGEGNSDSHMKSTVTGASITCIISNGKLILGTWQSIYFCEFDGARDRKIYTQIIGK